MMNHDAPSRMRLHLSIASWRSQGSKTGYCYTETVRDLSQRHDVTHESWSNDAMLERTRSIVLTRFRETSTADVFLWADGDTIWRTANGLNDAERLCASAYRTRGIVGGVYSKRGFGKGITVRFARGADTPKNVNIGDDLLLPAELVGAGFMAIHREALDRIAPTLPVVHDDVNGDWQPFCKTWMDREPDGRMHFVAEDEALCLHALRCDVPLVCDVAVVLGHEGEHVFTVADGERKA